MTLFFYVGLACVFLAFNAVFNGAETGFVSLDIDYLRYRARSKNASKERSLIRLAESPERFLALTLIGTNSFLVLATSILTGLVQTFNPAWLEIETILVSIFIFVFCEFLPKMAFSYRPLKFCLKFLSLLTFFEIVFHFPVVIVSTFTRSVMKVIGIGQNDEEGTISRDELLILLGHGLSSGTIQEHSSEMAKGIIGMREKHVNEIMIPRISVTGLEENSPLGLARKTILDSGFSRIPIYREEIGQVVGILYFKDLFLRGDKAKTIVELMTTPYFVPEMKSGFELFKEMKEKNLQVSVVLDEFGSMSGIVTFEDLLEEFVGEIHDEFDKPVSGIKFHDDGSYTVRCEISLSDINDKTELKLESIDGVTTLNGIILATLGRIPATGETFEVNSYLFRVLKSDGRKVETVKIFPEEGLA